MTRRRAAPARERAPLATGRYSTDPADHPAQHERGIPNRYRITLALDAAGLYGPEVDEACAADEPAVDRWEDGTLEPSPYQLALLANLTRMPLSYFYLGDPPMAPAGSGGWVCTRRKVNGSRCNPLPAEVVSPAEEQRRARAAKLGGTPPPPAGGTQVALF